MQEPFSVADAILEIPAPEMQLVLKEALDFLFEPSAWTTQRLRDPPGPGARAAPLSGLGWRTGPHVHPQRSLCTFLDTCDSFWRSFGKR